MVIIAAVCFSSMGAVATETQQEVEFEPIVPFFTHMIAADHNLQSFAGGRLGIFGATQVRPGFVGVVIVELQQNGRTIQTWSATGGTQASVSRDHFVPSGHQYRLRLTHQARNSSGQVLESHVFYSRTVTVN